MKVELLYFEDCPNWRTAADRLQGVAAARGLAVDLREVVTAEQAAASGFGGSPTILIDGRDPFATGHEVIGMACRI